MLKSDWLKIENEQSAHAHKSDLVLGADQKKSGLCGRDWYKEYRMVLSIFFSQYKQVDPVVSLPQHELKPRFRNETWLHFVQL